MERECRELEDFVYDREQAKKDSLRSLKKLLEQYVLDTEYINDKHIYYQATQNFLIAEGYIDESYFRKFKIRNTDMYLNADDLVDIYDRYFLTLIRDFLDKLISLGRITKSHKDLTLLVVRNTFNKACDKAYEMFCGSGNFGIILFLYCNVLCLMKCGISASRVFHNNTTAFQKIMLGCVVYLCDKINCDTDEVNKLKIVVFSEFAYYNKKYNYLYSDIQKNKPSPKKQKAIAILIAGAISWSSVYGHALYDEYLHKQNAVKMRVEVSCVMTSNNHVGNDWEHDFYFDDTTVFGSGSNRQIVNMWTHRKINLKSVISELDVITDTGKTKTKYKVSEGDIRNGFRVTQNVAINENRGNYSGNVSTWVITWKFTPLY